MSCFGFSPSGFLSIAKIKASSRHVRNYEIFANFGYIDRSFWLPVDLVLGKKDLRFLLLLIICVT